MNNYREIPDLKQQVATYPPKLKAKIVSDGLWLAEFTLLFARDYAAKGDIYNTVGCLTRVTTNLTQALFALNERYYLRDKQVMATIGAFPLLPDGYGAQIDAILAHPGRTAAELMQTVQQLAQVWHAVVALAGNLYQQKFQL